MFFYNSMHAYGLSCYREHIEEMVESAISQCRRDLLWQRMLLTTNMAEEEGRRKRRSERVDPDQEKDPVSFNDICYMYWSSRKGLVHALGTILDSILTEDTTV